MTPLELWRYKVQQTLHDPLHKLAVQGLLRHAGAGAAHLAALTGAAPRPPFRAPDRLATGADRPDVGSRSTCYVSWQNAPLVTHPLQPGVRLQVEWDALPLAPGARAAARDLDERVLAALRPLALPPGGWDSPAEVRQLQLRLWRRAPEILRELGLQAPYLPADSRCPDHSVWEHTRVASAAAFLVELDTRTRPPEREPWMLACTLGGIQRFLAETRKTRDLWTASMIYADLAWAAMLPVVAELGPDAVLYPDLRGNPAADRWLLATAAGAVPDTVRLTGAASHAAMLPNTFVALVPRGGGGSGLPAIEELAGRCAAAVGERWRELAAAVESHLERRAGAGAWRQIWARQLAARLGEPAFSWVAAPWLRRLDGIGPPRRGPALPGQAPGAAPPPPRPAQLDERERALSPWLPGRVWAHYELARDVFWHTDGAAGTDYLSRERGFDYPLVHHQLRAALAMRRAAAVPRAGDEPGEKCSLTGREQVLHDAEAGEGPPVERRRAGARRFWARFDSDGAGAERLGSTAAVKRFLVQAAEPAFTATWETPRERAERGGREPRVPFPSMAAIAAGTFLERLAARAAQPRIAATIARFAAAFDRSGLDQTVDRRALAALARAAAVPAMADLTAIEPELLFPETLEAPLRRAPPARRPAIAALRTAAIELRRAAAAAGIPPPRKLVAVLRMDGDHLSRLILGDPEVIRTCWQDVLHPAAADQVRERLAATGWPGLLAERRHLGPALHAAITRALADFAHLVGWVVEREFNGRLIYAGGDDLLALLPAIEAVPAAARLQQLFSAPFVLDTDAAADPWSQRRGELPGTTAEARRRLRVPLGDGGAIRLSAGRFEAHAAAGGEGEEAAGDLPSGRPVALHTMLGRAHSLSAGIAIGHYKTPLASLLATAGDLLDREAKERLGRGALAAALLTGGGGKATFASRWCQPAGETGAAVDTRPPGVQRDLRRVVAAFAAGLGSPALPGRLPYKLRESILATGAVLLDAGSAGLVRRLVQRECGLPADREPGRALLAATTALVEAGLHHARALQAERSGEGQPPAPAELAQTAVGGLLLARALAADGSPDGQP